jgi:hypothetical protein
LELHGREDEKCQETVDRRASPAAIDSAWYFWSDWTTSMRVRDRRDSKSQHNGVLTQGFNREMSRPTRSKETNPKPPGAQGKSQEFGVAQTVSKRKWRQRQQFQFPEWGEANETNPANQQAPTNGPG